MIRAAIVEDEELYMNQLEDYLHRYERESGYEIHISKFTDGEQILFDYQGEYDIILLDIQMKLMDGISTAENIRRLDEEVIIMFITNMTQYAIQGYKVEAFDYMVKPIEYFNFAQRLGRAVSRMHRREERYVSIPMKEGVRKLKISSIFYIESQSHKIIYHTGDGVFVSRGTMKDLEKAFEKYGFSRSNKGYLVNMRYVDGIKDNCCVIRDEKLPISRARRKIFMETLANYMSEVMK